MPGRWSINSVLWKAREKWGVEPFAPPRKSGEAQAHSAAGRHQREQIAVLCEAQGIPEAVWNGVEGMCSTEGNKSHRDGTPAVFRPRGSFAPQSLGRYPTGGESSLFDPAALDQAMARWRATMAPEQLGLQFVRSYHAADSQLSRARFRGRQHHVGAAQLRRLSQDDPGAATEARAVAPLLQGFP